MKKRRYKNNITPPVVSAQLSPAKRGKKPEITDTRGSGKMEIDYFRFYESLARKEIADYQAARAARRDPFNPLTYPIQQLYKDAMLDNHLQGAIENRILRVVNKEVVIKDNEGNIDKQRSRFVQTSWFRELLRRAMESKFYGYSMVLISDFMQGNIKGFTDIPRENIIPESGKLLKNAMVPDGEHIKFREFPAFFIYIQLLGNSVGILERISPLTIFKRHSWASWDEFEQIFGIPIRIARTMINTKKHKDELQQWLEHMGSANYGIFDKQTDIEIKENQKSDSFNVFLQKITAIDKQISKGVIGQTMTMDEGGSLSQAQIHLQTFNEITKSDIMDIQDWATDNFFPIMRMYGYDIPEGYYIELIEKQIIEPKDKIAIDKELLNAGYRIDPKYIEEFYGTPLIKDDEGENSFFV